MIQSHSQFHYRQRLFLLTFFFCFLLTLPLAAQRKKKINNPPLPLLNIDLGKSRQAMEESKPEEIVIDSSNIAILDYIPQAPPPKKKLSRTVRHRMARWTQRPANSLAAKIVPAVMTRQIRWFPHWGGNYPNGINVNAACISPDKSIIAFLETLGASSGPFATRLILYDTHTWEIIQAQDLKEVYALNCAWNNDFITLICKGQKSRHTKNTIALYDPVSKKIVSQTPIDFEPGKNLITDENSWLLLAQNNPERVHLFKLDAGSNSFNKMKSFEDFTSPPALGFKAGAKHFFLCDKDFFYICRLSDKRLNEKIPLPKNSLFIKPEKILPLDRNAFLLLPNHASGAQAGFLKNNRIIPVGKSSSGIAVKGIMPDTFITGFSKGGEFGVYHQASLQRLNLFSATAAKPRTQGNIVFAFHVPHAKAVAVLDSRGVFYLLYPDRINKRYLKEVLTKKLQ